ncbi:MAG: hypothetical protein ACK4ZJ_17855, partial [Allorhizobium sp.]
SHARDGAAAEATAHGPKGAQSVGVRLHLYRRHLRGAAAAGMAAMHKSQLTLQRVRLFVAIGSEC